MFWNNIITFLAGTTFLVFPVYFLLRYFRRLNCLLVGNDGYLIESNFQKFSAILFVSMGRMTKLTDWLVDYTLTFGKGYCKSVDPCTLLNNAIILHPCMRDGYNKYMPLKIESFILSWFLNRRFNTFVTVEVIEHHLKKDLTFSIQNLLSRWAKEEILQRKNNRTPDSYFFVSLDKIYICTIEEVNGRFKVVFSDEHGTVYPLEHIFELNEKKLSAFNNFLMKYYSFKGPEGSIGIKLLIFFSKNY